MRRKIHNDLLKKKSEGRKSLAVLIDPDKADARRVNYLVNIAVENRIDYFLVGGSLVSNYSFRSLISALKSKCDIPVVIFPGSSMHLFPEADGVLFLSLISGRNADLLIGQHVAAAPLVQTYKLEAISTGYMLIDGGKPTTASYMSGSQPIPRDKPDIAKWTAVAGQLLGMQMVYLDGGSGAHQPVPPEMIKAVSEALEIPVMVGGGLNTLGKVERAVQAGADIVVVGNGVEKNPDWIIEVSEYFNKVNSALNID